MAQSHPYSIINHSRAFIARHLGFLASSLSAVIGLFILSFVEPFPEKDVFNDFILRPLVAGGLFAVIYFLFGKIVWKFKWVSKLLKIPNLNGKWHCNGVVYGTGNDGKRTRNDWSGTLEINQCWEKIFIRLKTKDSESFTSFAAAEKMATDEIRLVYSYYNTPNMEPKSNPDEFESHIGFCDIVFDSNLESANGEFFSKRNEYNLGTLSLSKPVREGAKDDTKKEH